MSKKFNFLLSRCMSLNGKWTPEKSLCLVILNISDVCNKSCSFCPRGQGYVHPAWLPDYMALETVIILCRQLGRDYNGNISISGFGEPTFHDDLLKILELIKLYCPRCSLCVISNGYRLTEDIIDSPLLSFVILSVYSEEDYDYYYSKFGEHKNLKYRRMYGAFLSGYELNNRAGNVDVCSAEEGLCAMPFFQVFVDVDGSVYQCSSDWKRENCLGKIICRNIYDIFIKQFGKLRKDLLAGNRRDLVLCSRCSGYNAGYGYFEYFYRMWARYYNS